MLDLDGPPPSSDAKVDGCARLPGTHTCCAHALEARLVRSLEGEEKARALARARLALAVRLVRERVEPAYVTVALHLGVEPAVDVARAC